MSQTLTLFRLQQTDSRMDAIQSRLEAIRLTLENDRNLVRARQQAEATEAGLKSAERDLRAAEAEVEGQRIKIEQSENSLYSGKVRNPKELQDLQNEVASLKRYLATLEDRLLEAMLRHEEAEENHRISLDHLSRVRSQVATQSASLTAENDSLVVENDRLKSERQAISSALDERTLGLYEGLRSNRRGRAVAEVSDGACEACGANLTPAQQQAARSGSQISYCSTCGRILYAS
ncbi:MAG: C4-type zinc ribbon domain-containing protein [Chloroflexota bacterium]